MKKIIFDLDGTLIDSRQRLFKLFSFLVPHSTLSFEEYWLIKGKGIEHKDIIRRDFNFQDSQILIFQENWMKLIEDDDYLIFDQPLGYATQTLLNLKQKGFELILLTARQNPNKVEEQLIKFNWFNVFADVLVTKQLNSKKELLVNSKHHEKAIMMIGDTGYDISTANDLNIFSVGVLTGFHSFETLNKYNPNIILNSIDEIFSIV